MSSSSSDSTGSNAEVWPGHGDGPDPTHVESDDEPIDPVDERAGADTVREEECASESVWRAALNVNRENWDEKLVPLAQSLWEFLRVERDQRKFSDLQREINELREDSRELRGENQALRREQTRRHD
ncbi:hypothetical protein KEM56_001275 [Ascosphaera pollenicola]|nr:hypothetical protein KEM56_001275 [Ascosphaera pollenicola]